MTYCAYAGSGCSRAPTCADAEWQPQNTGQGIGSACGADSPTVHTRSSATAREEPAERASAAHFTQAFGDSSTNAGGKQLILTAKA
eukprot:1409275-Heterocapsa_arctica.AAC.1